MDRPEARPTEREAAGLEIADVEVAGMTDDRLCLVLLAQTENAVGRIDIAVAGIGTVASRIRVCCLLESSG